MGTEESRNCEMVTCSGKAAVDIVRIDGVDFAVLTVKIHL